jgi:hypothetical protein
VFPALPVANSFIDGCLARRRFALRVLAIIQRHRAASLATLKPSGTQPRLLRGPPAVAASLRYARPVELASVNKECRLRRSPTRVSVAVPIVGCGQTIADPLQFLGGSDARLANRRSRRER